MASILGTWDIRTATEEAPFAPGTKVTLTEGEDGNVIVVVTAGDKEEEYAGRYDASRTKVIVDLEKEQRHWEFVASESLGGPLRDLRRMYGFSWAATVAQPDPIGAWAADPQGA